MRLHGLLESIIVGVFAVANLHSVAGHQEHFTSAEELAIWPEKVEQLAHDIDSIIEVNEKLLEHLRFIRRILELSWSAKANEPSHKSDNFSITRQQNSEHKRIMLNPVSAFVVLNRIRRVITELEWNDDEVTYSDDGRGFASSSLKNDIFELITSHPLHEDHRGAGLALLRLQAFYDLNISNLIEGRLVPSDHSPSIRMDAMDSFELGRMAYEDGQQAMTILWMYAALHQASEKHESTTHAVLADQTINEILDYMAIAAYEMGSLEYAAKLTKAWLERDPDNWRARENLLIYQEELAEKSNNQSHTEDEIINQAYSEPARDATPDDTLDCKQNVSKLYKQVEIDNYKVGDDAVVKRLCLESGFTPPDTRNKCELSRAAMHNGHFYPGLKREILRETPKIIRIHDIVSREEAMYLRRMAKPNLKRSTIMSTMGLQASNFRIAKTAWLRGDQDHVVARVEQRLSSLLNLAMEQSEQLQVVNYGLGGFYGPHMDSARATNLKRNDTILNEQLNRSDRLATILIYLSRVDAGGSTVFPRLNLTVKSIERSAVVWFNILEDGYSDERTLHTGCPVLLGTKWIATKWPHEEANSFRRPCKV